MRTLFNPDIDHCPICNKQLESMSCITCNIEWTVNEKETTINGISINGRKITMIYNGDILSIGSTL